MKVVYIAWLVTAGMGWTSLNFYRHEWWLSKYDRMLSLPLVGVLNIEV